MSWRYVRPDENWIRSVALTGLTASSEQVGYEVEHLADDNPAWQWWSSSTTANFAADLLTPREIGIIALIMNNADAGTVISVTGDVTTSITAARQANAYPKNVAHIPVTAFTGQNFTFSVTGTTADWAVGEVVIGKLREWPDSLLIDPLPTFDRIRQVIRDVDEDYEHELRTDLGSEMWIARGRIYRDEPDFAEFLEWWETTKGGSIPTLIVPDDHAQEPRLVRMDVGFTHERQGSDKNWIAVTFTECGRGILVV